MRALALLLVAACAASPRPAPPPPPAPVLPTDSDQVAALAGDEASLMADVRWLSGPELRGRGARGPEARQAADALAERLRQLGYQVTLLDIPGWSQQVNVLARLPGDLPAIMLTAHVDHLGATAAGYYPGADDNASGVAAVLAAAGALSKTRPVGAVYVLLTGAEEQGLIGSQAYVQAPSFPLADVAFVLNLDMVGRRFFSGGDATFGILGLESSRPFSAAMRAAARAEHVTLVSVPASLPKAIGMGDRSDDWPFREAGVPAAHLSTGISPDYHRESDTADQISPAQLVRAARLTARAVHAVASLPASARR